MSGATGRPSPGLGERDAVRRLLQRVGMGIAPGDLDAAVERGFEATLAAFLTSAGKEGAEAAAPPAVPLTAPGLNESGARQLQQKNNYPQARQLAMWWLDRMASGESPLRERMTWFWHGHFATSYRGVGSAPLMLQQNQTQRRLALGDFGVLARAMVVDPAMLVWLNGNVNSKGKPNENLAREFMELFTLGVGEYAEADVRQAARALTGWRVQFASGTSAVVDREHDSGPETVLGSTMAFDADSLTYLLTGRRSSAEFLALRMWRRFIGETPPDRATLAVLVDAYGPRRDTASLLTALVRSPAFRDPRSVLVLQPVEWLVAALRALRTRASTWPPDTLLGGLSGMGQVPFDPPSVGGWPSGPRWLTPAAALSRLRLSQALVSKADLSPVVDAPAARRIDEVAALLGLPGFTARTRTALALLSGNPSQLVAAALTSPECSVSA